MLAEKDPAALKALAESVRKKWIERLNSGMVDVHALIQLSKSTGENQYIAAIRLFSILAARPGWTKATSLDALKQHGFTDKTTIRTLRKNTSQIEVFETLLKSTADRWRARPEPPKGWPWSGKLSVLIQNAGEQVPDELLALMEDDGQEEAPEDGNGLDSDLLDMLQGDDWDAESEDG